MVIGRAIESKKIDSLYKSTSSEFLVVYGRRRVGKTYLVREKIKNYKDAIFFHVTGKYKANMASQLSQFSQELSKTYYRGASLARPANWEDAFKLLNAEIEREDKKTVLFLDELPWLCTTKSELLETIDHYWNHFWSHNDKVLLIVCGSAAAWMIKNIIHDKGGLHNRITGEIKLLPFSLSETKEYLAYRNLNLTIKQITKLYMAIGGVPYYLNYIDKGRSADQSIQKLFFDENAPLKFEFKKLFSSLFKNASAYQELVTVISNKRIGRTRSEIQNIAKQSSNGGRLTSRLEELCAAGFLQSYYPWGKKNGQFYKLIDEYCLFYLQWVKQETMLFTEDHWQSVFGSATYYAWAGYAFEAVCWKHINCIIKQLNLPSGGTISSWRVSAGKLTPKGAQIDLLIDRNDDAITLCEIKYTDKAFVIDKSYAQALQNKIDVFKEVTKTKKQLFLVMIASQGITENKYSTLLVDGAVILNDMF